MVKFTVPGRPQSFELRKARGHYYVPKEAKAYQEYVARMAKCAILKKTKKDVVVKIRAYFRDRNFPDIDNVIRPVLNACTGVVYADDCQVAEVTARRDIDSYERLEVEIKEV